MSLLKVFNTVSSYSTAKDGKSISYPNISFVEEDSSVRYLYGPYEWVDLGLPSGLKWAAWNVGSTKPEEFGLYFAWGETQGYAGVTTEKQFTWADYTLCDGTINNMLKYNAIDGLTTLELSDDVAYTTDNTCRIPTADECQELIDNTTSEWAQVNGVSGMLFTSNVNDNSIFVPAAGNCYDGVMVDVGTSGCLWSSNVFNNYYRAAHLISFSQNDLFIGYGDRAYTSNVRPVKE